MLDHHGHRSRQNQRQRNANAIINGVGDDGHNHHESASGGNHDEKRRLSNLMRMLITIMALMMPLARLLTANIMIKISTVLLMFALMELMAIRVELLMRLQMRNDDYVAYDCDAGVLMSMLAVSPHIR